MANKAPTHRLDTQEPTTAPALPPELASKLSQHTQTGGSLADRKATKQKEQPSKKTAAEKPAKDSDTLEDPALDAAVDEIVKEEGDAVLDADDEEIEALPAEAPKPKRRWVTWLRRIILALLLAATAVVFAVPSYRYYALNKAGIRSSMSLRVLDQGTQLPLQNVHVTLDGNDVVTDSKGVARMSKIKLGPHTMVIHRVAFASIKQNVTIGWGSNPLGDFTLDPTGVKYVIQPTDFITGKPIANAQATSGDAVANADSKGIITLTLDGTNGSAITVDVSGDHYVTKRIIISASSTKATPVSLVSSVKSVYVSHQSGTYDLMSAYVDGSGVSMLLKGTGSENSNISLAVDQAGARAALVSTRDNQRNSDGDLLSALTLVNIADGTSTTIDHAEHIQLVDWIGTSVIFQETTSGTGANKYHVVAYDYASSRRYELGSAAQFNSVVSMQGMIYYAVASSDGGSAVLYKVRPDGSGRQTVLNKEVWSAFRVNYGTLYLQTPDGWYSLSAGSGNAQQIGSPSTYTNNTYIEGPAGKSLWIDANSNPSVLYAHDAAANNDTKIVTQGGLAYPVRWLTDSIIVYRVASGSSATDYAVSVSGGAPKKIADVVTTYAYNN